MWVIIALITTLIEIFTLGFSIICISIGALAAALVAYFGAGVEWQILVFAIVAGVALVAVRPLILKLFRRASDKHSVETNVNALVGREARVSSEIKSGEGRVKIDGDDWRAETIGSDETISVGERVIVLEVRSVILIVKKA